MHRNTKWGLGVHLARLYHWNLAQLTKTYPDYPYNTLKGKKAYWTQKIKKGVVPMPPKPEGEATPQPGKLMRTWEVARGNQNDEWDVITLHSYDHSERQQLSDFISQADPVKIVPSKRKPMKRDHKLIVAFGDSQIDYRYIDGEYHPVHDERALQVVRLMCKDLQPDTIVNLGDTVDLASLSRFGADSNHGGHSMQPSFNRVHRLYAELRSDNPRAKIVETDSNHNMRLRNFFHKHNPELAYLKQAGDKDNYPVMSYPFLANLSAVQVDWVGGYGAAEYVYGEEYGAPPIVFKHGTITGKNVAQKESAANPETHIVRGHSHRPETAHRTMRNGSYLTYMVVGVTCSITGDVPSYHSAVDDMGRVVRTQEQWQQGLAIIEDYKDGTYNFMNVLIKDGKAKYAGKVYDGNE